MINDIGPYLPWTGLLRLGANLNDAPKSFETIEQAEGYYRWVDPRNTATSVARGGYVHASCFVFWPYLELAGRVS